MRAKYEFNEYEHVQMETDFVQIDSNRSNII